MKVNLHYGGRLCTLQIPEANIGKIIRPWLDEQMADNAKIVRQALADAEVENFRNEIAGTRLCVLVDDGTRDQPFDDIFAQLFGMLRASSLVRFLICTGTHEPATPQNDRIIEQIEKAAGQAGIRDFEIHVHNCDEQGLINAGKTSRGTEVLYNRRADDADVFLVLSDVKVHYFAGYSNPIKNFVPGICAYETAEQNHRLALDANSTFGVHPWHPDEARRTNPLAQDQLEGTEMITKGRPVYALTTISTSGKICRAQFGPAQKVSGDTFGVVDKMNTHTIKRRSRLIVSPGGLPNDISLYIAQRALELTKNVVIDGGEVLFLAACPDGIGEEKTMANFYNRLTAPVEAILKSIEGRYKLYSHKPYKFAQMIQRLRRIWMYSEIDDEAIKAAHLYPTNDPQAVVDAWLAEDRDVKITIADGANKIALYAQE
jgi:nickel-dependent lactate racemase